MLNIPIKKIASTLSISTAGARKMAERKEWPWIWGEENANGPKAKIYQITEEEWAELQVWRRKAVSVNVQVDASDPSTDQLTLDVGPNASQAAVTNSEILSELKAINTTLQGILSIAQRVITAVEADKKLLEGYREWLVSDKKKGENYLNKLKEIK